MLLKLLPVTRKHLVGFVALVSASIAAGSDDVFPQPAELKPDVDFWVSIFTEYTTYQGVLHDSRDLSIVYQSISFPERMGRRERQRRVVEVRQKIQTVLSVLAAGKRDGLSDDEARILALWPEGVGNATLVDASRNIRYQQGLKDRFREGLVRSGRWRNFIEQELGALSVPLELAALPHVESSYNPDARSHVGASGIWQFTRSTGRRFMRIDHVIDERNDPFAATRAAAKLLAYNYSIAGNWPMAITAYNHGLAGVGRAMRQFGDTAYTEIMRNYKGRTFGFASRNFYVAFLAAKHVDQNVDRYFPGLVVEPAADYSVVKLQNYLSVEDLGKALGVTQRQLADHNLALQSTVWQGSKHVPKDYLIRVPTRLLRQPLPALMAAVPAADWQTAQLPDLFHTIRRGDTLSQIAETYKTRVSTLVALNNLGSANRIRAGMELRLPAAGPAPATSRAEPEPPIAAEPEEAPVPVIAELAPSELAASLLGTIQTALLSDPSDYGVAADGSIEIHPLETLGHFADWLEIRTQRLRDINGLAFRTAVEVGQRIRLDLGKVDATTFEERRVAYHRMQQDSFFREHVITGVSEHIIRSGESIWVLASRRYDVPMWLFRQYNPAVDPAAVAPGTTVRFPVLTDVDAS